MLVNKNYLGFGQLVKFRGDDKEYVIKNVDASTKFVFVIHQAAQRILKKPISEIVKINRKEVTIK